ncbi:MAG TPA: tetrahydrofolate dehydrogenase/cyclohydrolase catalytic domain-containing protein [Bacteroidota bacterium]|nr:tetrahydrofolate dehydrogenase/cyclohydrolase catalytic domain-containing protein [Bacteroidota bacterium]
MAASIIDGRAIADAIRGEVRQASDRLTSTRGITPGLAFILVGENPASQAYVRMKGKGCEEAGFYSVTERLHESVSEGEVLRMIDRFNLDPRIHGILVQLPLPPHIREARVIRAIDFKKDVDGFHPVNVGRLVIGRPCLRPCTPLGIQELLIRSGIETAGRHVVVIGRSNIVGKPVANLLLQKGKGANAVVTVVHSAAGDLSRFTLQADILIAAMGRARFVTAGMVKEGAAVIDVGINRISDPTAKSGYRIVGDVDYDGVCPKAGHITPVPGGVGPMTIAMLLGNTLSAAAGTLYDD